MQFPLTFLLVVLFVTFQQSKGQPKKVSSVAPRIIWKVGPDPAIDFLQIESLKAPSVDSVHLLLWDRQTILDRRTLVNGKAELDVRYLAKSTYKLILFLETGDTTWIDVPVK